MQNESELLRRFADYRDEAAFAEVVRRHLGLVYVTCLRRLRDTHAAQDATQAVFIALARKARRVAGAPNVIGWLHRSACYETRNHMRAQYHRLARETEAVRLGTTTPEEKPHLATVEAVLDDVLCSLSPSDRDAILARYFAGQSYATIGASLRLTENAARMRVERALAKLRDQLGRRGITSTAAALALALPGFAASPVPAGLLATVTQAAVSSAVGAGAAATLFGIMSTTKLVTGAAVLAAAAGLILQHQRTTKLEAELAVAGADRSAYTKQLLALQGEIESLKESQRSSIPAAAAGQASNAKSSATPPAEPPPGVTPKAPPGWYANGTATDRYQVGVDANHAWGGMPSAYAKSIAEAKGKFGGMMQTIAADAFHNQRVKLTAWIKTQDVPEGAHLWLRVDGPGQGNVLQFDNMNGRAPKGTTDWDEYSVVLDVAPEAKQLAYGFFVGGEGQMWVNGLTLTPVGNDVPSTAMQVGRALPKTPVNLGFSPPKK